MFKLLGLNHACPRVAKCNMFTFNVKIHILHWNAIWQTRLGSLHRQKAVLKAMAHMHSSRMQTTAS
eukprot:736984-Lingulodinium_polyedra.AAC.1